jgi:hypothetical protein
MQNAECRMTGRLPESTRREFGIRGFGFTRHSAFPLLSFTSAFCILTSAFKRHGLH